MNKGRSRLVAAHDAALDRARDIVEQARAGAGRAEVRSFFDEPTFTASYVVHDPATKRAAILDSVREFDAAAGRTRAEERRVGKEGVSTGRSRWSAERNKKKTTQR